MACSLQTEAKTDACNAVKPVPAVKFMNVTWENYKVSILTLALKIYSSDWQPDHIICIGRGGMTPGDALSHLFNETLGVIMCSSYGGAGEMQQGNLNIAEHISITKKHLSGKILLVDDLVDSGKTLSELKAMIKEKHLGVTEVKTAVIYQKTCTKYLPDYYGEAVDEKVWIVLPNENFDKVKLSQVNKNYVRLLSDEKLKEFAQTILERAGL